MTDIHSHIVPNVDDGSESMEMSLTMMLSAYEQGVRTFFATPHSSAFSPSPYRALDAFWELKTQARRYFPEAGVYLGCEIRCEADRMDRVLKGLRKGTYPTMNATDYVLTEFSQWVQPENTLPCIAKLTKAGWKPIIAHIERYPHLWNQSQLVDSFLDMGCLLQANVYSFFDEEEDCIRLWAQQLAREEKIHFLGTDMHRTYHRPPSVERGLQWLRENCESPYVDAIAFGNAQALLKIT